MTPWESDAALPPPADRRVSRLRLRVAVVGAIGIEKGYEYLLACARHVTAQRLAMEFVVVGHTCDDKRLLDTGAVQITGNYEEAEAVELIRAQDAELGFLPALWPETWSYTLSQLWQAGLDVVAFDIGAPAERIRATAPWPPAAARTAAGRGLPGAAGLPEVARPARAEPVQQRASAAPWRECIVLSSRSMPPRDVMSSPASRGAPAIKRIATSGQSGFLSWRASAATRQSPSQGATGCRLLRSLAMTVASEAPNDLGEFTASGCLARVTPLLPCTILRA